MTKIPTQLTRLIQAINEHIINPAIILIFAVAMVVFLWGLISYIRGAGDPKARESGRSRIIWGIIGFAIMFSVFGIMQLVSNTVGGPTGEIINIQKL